MALARMAGKVAIVSGGSGGIGAATCAILSQKGATVVVADLVDARGQDVVTDIVAAGGQASYRHHDVTSESSWQALIEYTVQTYGQLDVLVNNAGITDTRGLAETTAESWDRMVAVDQTGVLLGMKHAAAAMRDGGGSIVNISSIAGIVGIPGSSIAYTASKGAVRLMTKFAAVELAPRGIRVNSVHPGRVDTDMVKGQAVGKVEYMLARTPLARNATPEDIAYGVLYLASPESSYVTGAELVIDGGFTAQ
jgi:cyclopentanol dehydrogenase